LSSQAVPLVLAGEHAREAPPVDGGRWPVSVVFLPDRSAAVRLDGVSYQAAGIAGDGHWRSGALGFSHVTVRALEHFRQHIDDDDAAVERYARAVRAAARRCGPVRLHLSGLTLAPGSVMACAQPVDGEADRFRTTLAEELGPDGWREAELPARDIWYVTLLHFAADIPDPERLVCWVDERRELDLGPVSLDWVALVRFVHVEEPTLGMRPTVLADVLLDGPSALA
jgi:hypothetical protein